MNFELVKVRWLVVWEESQVMSEQIGGHWAVCPYYTFLHRPLPLIKNIKGPDPFVSRPQVGCIFSIYPTELNQTTPLI